MKYWRFVRTFLAASIPRFQGTEDLFREIAAIKDSKPVKTSELHLTFRFFGEVSPEWLEKIKAQLSAIPFRRFSIRVHGIGAFPSIQRANVLFLEVENSAAMLENARLAAAMEPASHEKKPFVPHITVSRFRKPADCSTLKNKFTNITYEKSIEKITIYESVLNEKGPVYTELSSFQLK